MAQRNGLRASDADREHVADRLRQATAEGRLLAEELEQRLGRAFRARTYGELDAIVDDLPSDRVRSPRPLGGFARPALIVAMALAAAAVIAAAVLVIAGMLAVWGVWLLVAWWMLGGRCAHHRRTSRGHWHVHTVSRQAPRAWL